VGTFPLPESQLDRFLMRIELGYPDHDAERTLLQGRGPPRHDRRPGRLPRAGRSDGSAGDGEDRARRGAASRLHPVLVEHSRRSPEYATGLSPRAALALLHASRAWALIEGRDKVVPEDVQAVLPGVAGHRLRPVHDGVRASSLDKASGLISAVPIREPRPGPAIFAGLQFFPVGVSGSTRPSPAWCFLSQRRVYILPTRHGLNLRSRRDPDADRLDQLQPLPRLRAHVSARGLGIVSILHTFRNLAHLYVSAGRAAPVFAGTRPSSSSSSRTRATSTAISLDLTCRGTKVSWQRARAAASLRYAAGEKRENGAGCSSNG